MANVGAGLFQGMPVSTSLSASSLNESVGREVTGRLAGDGRGRRRDACPFRAAVLRSPQGRPRAAIIEAVVFGMIDFPELRRLYRVKRFDFWIAVAAMLGRAVGRRASRRGRWYRPLPALADQRRHAPAMPILGREAGTQVYRDFAEHPEDKTDPGVTVIGTSTVASSSPRRRHWTSVRAILGSQPGLCVVVLDFEGVNWWTRKAQRRSASSGADRGRRHRASPGPPEAQRVCRARRDGLIRRSGTIRSTGTSTERSRRRRPYKLGRPDLRKGNPSSERGRDDSMKIRFHEFARSWRLGSVISRGVERLVRHVG